MSKELLEELDKLDKKLEESGLGPVATKYHSVIRDAMYGLRAIAGENPKSQELIIKIF